MKNIDEERDLLDNAIDKLQVENYQFQKEIAKLKAENERLSLDFPTDILTASLRREIDKLKEELAIKDKALAEWEEIGKNLTSKYLIVEKALELACEDKKKLWTVETNKGDVCKINHGYDMEYFKNGYIEQAKKCD